MKKKLLFLPTHKWYSKNLSSIFAFIIIMVIAVLIYLYAVDIPKNVVDVLLGVAAISATFFTYLTFKESRRSNEIKLYEDYYGDYKKYADAEDAKMNDKIFTQTGKLLTDQIHNYSGDFSKMTLAEYLYTAPRLFSAINKNYTYKKYIKLLGRKKRVILNDDEDIIEASNFADALTELCELNATVDMGYWDLLHLCNEINLFPFLFPEQKEVLMRRLYSPYCSYNSKVFAIITDRKDYRCVSKFNYFKNRG